MRKQLFSFIATTSIIGSAFAQLPVSTLPTHRKVLLEQFTAINSSDSPNGHTTANTIKAAKPMGDVILVNIHGGGFAEPNQGQPDFRTSDGDAIMDMNGMNVNFFPQVTGAINRHLFYNMSDMAIDRENWAKYADSVLAKPSYVNVALEGFLNVNTRVLTVNAQVYYTGNSPVTNNYLTIALLEDDVVGPQSGMQHNPDQVNPDGSYSHQNLFRKVLTPVFGQTITTTNATNTYSTSLSYTVPLQYVNNVCNIGGLKLAAFVSQTQKEIITAAYGPITMTGIANATDAGLSALSVETEVCVGKVNPSLKLMNYGNTPITSALISYNVNGAAAQTYTYTNTSGLNPYKNTKLDLPQISFPVLTTNTLNITVTKVNNSSDQNTVNDIVTKTILSTTVTVSSNYNNMSMNFTQDQFGSQSTWSVIDEATGTTIATGGPYEDYNIPPFGPFLHTVNFTVTPNSCYKLVVKDSYSNGINGGAFGESNYKILAGSDVIISSDGKYGAGETRKFKTVPTGSNVGINQVSSLISNINIYPNPASTTSTLEIELVQNEALIVSVVNAFGQIVYTETRKEAAAGVQKIQLNSENWASGIYNVHVSTTKGAINRKLTIAK